MTVHVARGPAALTASGREFYPLSPSVDAIAIEDIAHALAHQCRFNGHTRVFYSIAEHCVSVSRLCAPEDALWGLLHDAAEAYLGDLIAPVKYLPDLWAYRDLEARVLQVIAEAFSLELPIPSSVATADNWMLQIELRALLPMPATWHCALPEEISRLLLATTIAPLPPEPARAAFLQRFEALTGTRVADGSVA